MGFVRGRHIRQGTHRVTHAHHRAETRRAHVQHVGTVYPSDPRRAGWHGGNWMRKAGEHAFGAKIEDCWLPFFCMTLDLISCAPIVRERSKRRRRGGTCAPPWRSSGSSPSRSPRPGASRDRDRGGRRRRSAGASDSKKNSDHKPGRLHVLVDGGYVNNLPTDVMRAMGARVVIGWTASGGGLRGGETLVVALSGAASSCDSGSRVGSAAVPRVPPWLPCSHTSRTSRITPTPPDDSAPWTSWYVPSSPTFRSSRSVGTRKSCARVTRRAFARFERGNSQTRTSYRRWTTARARGDPPRAEAAEDAREEEARLPSGGGGGGGCAAPEARRRRVAKRERAHASGTQGGFFFRGWGFDGGGGEDEDAWEGSYDRPGAGAGRGRYDWDEDSDDGGGGGGGGAAFEGERRAEAWVRGGGRYDRGFASPDQPAPSMTRRRVELIPPCRFSRFHASRRWTTRCDFRRRAAALIQVSHTGASSRARIAHRSTALERRTDR